uniref:HNH endonuclease n=1 Tax=Streptomyces phage Scarif TaxID=3158858 RepID=A0AAU7GZR1_9CAUD
MGEQWVEIASFPGYSVSDAGQVRNDETGHIMTRCANQGGVVHVGLTRNKTQYKRSLTLLVAEAFLPRPSFAFDTPINLDGDRWNNSVENLMWRPRWFAVKYFQQFKFGSVGSIARPIEIIETEEQFANSFEATKFLGVLDREVAMSVMTQNYVWPIYQRFRLVRM